jgi:hypothetical protein
MVQKSADVLNRFSGIPAKLGSSVSKDMDSRRSNASLFEVALQVTIERSAGESFALKQF